MTALKEITIKGEPNVWKQFIQAIRKKHIKVWNALLPTIQKTIKEDKK